MTAGDVNLIDKSQQPIFTVKENYYKTGVVGGVLPYRARIIEKARAVIDRMISGTNMRDIPLDPVENGGACIDYPQLEKKGLKDAKIPDGTVFRNKPNTSIIQSNPLLFAVLLMIIISGIQLVMYYFLFKGKTDTFMKRHEIKINQLPVNYFIGKVKYNENGEPVQVDVTPGNQKAVTLWEMHAGECRCEPLFTEPELLKAVARLTDDGLPSVYTDYFLKTDSYYEVHINKGFDPNTLEIFCFNITQRIKSQNELQYTSAMLDMTLDLAQIVPWHWNAETHTIIARDNDALKKIIHSTESSQTSNLEVPEEEFYKLVHPDDIERVKDAAKSIMNGSNQYVQMEFRFLLPNKATDTEEDEFRIEDEELLEWVEVNVSVEKYAASGLPEILIGSLLRITNRKERMRRLIEAREAAKEADRLKSAFLANMSHEIRTPLNAIVGFSNMLAHTEDRKQKDKFIKIIESNNDLLLQIISDILDLAKTEAGTMEFNMMPTDLNNLMITIGESTKSRVKPGVDLVTRLGSPELWIETDPNRLSQVVINFITNACKFTTEGSITYGYEVRDNNLYFYCRDTGSGISEENLKKVFERFVKLNSFVNGTDSVSRSARRS